MYIFKDYENTLRQNGIDPGTFEERDEIIEYLGGTHSGDLFESENFKTKVYVQKKISNRHPPRAWPCPRSRIITRRLNLPNREHPRDPLTVGKCPDPFDHVLIQIRLERLNEKDFDFKF